MSEAPLLGVRAPADLNPAHCQANKELVERHIFFPIRNNIQANVPENGLSYKYTR